MDRIETGLHLGHFENVSPTFFKFMANSLDIKVVFAQNLIVCDVTIISSVKEFHITIFEF